jgi:hypothetical protein
MEMNRRKFLAGVGAALASPWPSLSLGPFDPYDKFLLELSQRVRETIIQHEITMDRLVIDPLANGRRLVHLHAADGREFQWYQDYGPKQQNQNIGGHGNRYLCEIRYPDGNIRRTFLLDPRWAHFHFRHWGDYRTDVFVFRDLKFGTVKIVNAAYHPAKPMEGN